MLMANKFWSIIKYVLTLATFVIIFLLFSWWGVFGYIIFVMLVAAWLLHKKWNEYVAIVDYGAKTLLNLRGKKNDRRKERK